MKKTDPIELELFRHLLVSIAEEMGVGPAQDVVFGQHQGAPRLFLRGLRRRAARRSPWAITCPCIWARCRCRCDAPREAFDLRAGRCGAGQRSVSRRNALARHHRGRGGLHARRAAAGVLCGQSRASRRCRRHEPGLHAAGARDLSGRHPHSSRAADPRRARSTASCCDLILANVRTPVEREGDLLAQMHGDPSRRSSGCAS